LGRGEGVRIAESPKWESGQMENTILFQGLRRKEVSKETGVIENRGQWGGKRQKRHGERGRRTFSRGPLGKKKRGARTEVRLNGPQGPDRLEKTAARC